jgi:hypothetical protein
MTTCRVDARLPSEIEPNSYSFEFVKDCKLLSPDAVELPCTVWVFAKGKNGRPYNLYVSWLVTRFNVPTPLMNRLNECVPRATITVMGKNTKTAAAAAGTSLTSLPQAAQTLSNDMMAAAARAGVKFNSPVFWNTPAGYALPCICFTLEALLVQTSPRDRALYEKQRQALLLYPDVFYSLWMHSRYYDFDATVSSSSREVSHDRSIDVWDNPLWFPRQSQRACFDCEDLEALSLSQFYSCPTPGYDPYFTIVQIERGGRDQLHVIAILMDSNWDPTKPSPHFLKPAILLDGADYVQGMAYPEDAAIGDTKFRATDGAQTQRRRPFITRKQWLMENCYKALCCMICPRTEKGRAVHYQFPPKTSVEAMLSYNNSAVKGGVITLVNENSAELLEQYVKSWRPRSLPLPTGPAWCERAERDVPRLQELVVRTKWDRQRAVQQAGYEDETGSKNIYYVGEGYAMKHESSN